MADANSLREAIAEYECQLAQVVKTLTTATEGSRRGELLCLKSNIQELIELTKESLQKLEGITINIADKLEYSSNYEDVENVESVENVGNVDDPLAQEYALFKAALEGNSDESKEIQQMDDSTTGECYEVEDELKQLEGTRCRARYESTWEGGGYHNAMICSVYRSSPLEDKSLHNVKVRVLFTNPTQKEMLPCQYYLNGRCKFSEKCRFSHGEVVLLSNLQEYREPNFLNIKTGSRVLTKQKDELWHRSIVLKTPEENEDVFRVKLEAKGDVVEVNVQDLVPLDDTSSEASDISDNDDNNDSDEPEIIAELIHKSLLAPQPNGPLGEWEKHTRGIGSKLMAQMGYVHGTGLGKKADGRIEPVEAVILPPGKSLDHCMELREMATDGKNLMTVERNLRKKKFRQKRKQKYRENQQAKRKEEGNVFNFLNTTLGNKDIMDQDKSLASTSHNNDLKNASIKNLNVANFKVGEDIMKLEKESSKLKNLMGRQVKGSITYNNIASRYNEKQKELENLRAREKNIVAEQSQRKNKKKIINILTIVT